MLLYAKLGKIQFFSKTKIKIFDKDFIMGLAGIASYDYSKQPPSTKKLESEKQKSQFLDAQFNFFSHLQNPKKLFSEASSTLDLYFSLQTEILEKRDFIAFLYGEMRIFLHGLKDPKYLTDYKKRAQIDTIEEKYVQLFYFGKKGHIEALRRKRLEKMHHFFPLYDQEPQGFVENIKDFIANILAKK